MKARAAVGGVLALASCLAACASPLVKASGDGDTAAIAQLLDQGADIHAGGMMMPPICYAALNGQDAAVRLLLQRGAKLDYTLCDPLGQAIIGNHVSTIRLLLAAGAHVTPANAAQSQWPQTAQAVRDVLEQFRATGRVPGEPAGSGAPDAAASAAPAVVSDVDAPRFRAAERPDDVAVVIGVEKYGGGLPSADYAEHDARAVRAHLLALGVPERNLFLLTGADASRAGFVKTLERRLPELVDEKSTVYVYYSGHGAPDPSTGKAYLLPVDGDPAYLEDTAYPVERLYRKLGALKARRVLVALDSCFSGAGGRSVLPKGARPLVTKIDEGVVPAGVASITASASNQISGALDEQAHGVFTYYLLKGLNGAAADAQGRITLSALYDYLSPKVQDAARRQNRDQKPELAASDAGFPLR